MHRPFQVLEQWIKEGRIRVSDRVQPVKPSAFHSRSLPDNLDDEGLFELAMKDVKPLGWSAVPLHPRPPLELQPQDDEQEALRAIEHFLRQGYADIQQAAEYIEASVQPHGRLYLNDLRAGRFSVQAHLDLHGLNLQQARFALDEFLLESVRVGFTCVRVIHGRGRHSRNDPVLKENIQRWLSSRRMSRHVIAYTSARRSDGGDGAVYVLLRK